MTVINLGSEKGIRYWKLFKHLKDFRKKLNYQIGSRREGDIEKVWADITLAATELNWHQKPAYGRHSSLSIDAKGERQLLPENYITTQKIDQGFMSSFNKTILITGGAGFIGSHVVRLFVNKYPEYRILNLDKLAPIQETKT